MSLLSLAVSLRLFASAISRRLILMKAAEQAVGPIIIIIIIILVVVLVYFNEKTATAAPFGVSLLVPCSISSS